MNLKEMLAQVAERTSLTQKQTREVYDALVDVTTEALQKDDVEKVALLNLVTLHKKPQAAATKRNPATGESIEVAAHTRLTAKPVKSLKDAVR